MVRPWTITEGLGLVRALQPDIRKFGYHLTLGGSVLNKGESKKDLDLYFLPLDNGKSSTADTLVLWLQDMWGLAENIESYEDDRVPQMNQFDPLPRDIRVRFINDDDDDARVEEEDLPRLGDRELWAREREQRGAEPQTAGSAFRYKLKFFRKSGDRIDVFVI